MPEPEAPLPEWLLERLAQGELRPAQELAAQRRLLAEPSGAARLAALKQDDAAFPTRPEGQALLATARAASARPPRRELRLPIWIGAAAAMAFAVVGLRATLWAPGDARDTRIKGLTPALAVYRHAGRDIERLTDGALVRPGDEVQLGYTAAGRRYGAIFSIDGRAVVTLHFPERADAAAEALRLSQPSARTSGPVPLARAAALDDAPGFERFFFVTSDQPIALGEVLAAAQALARGTMASAEPLRLPTGLEQTSVLLRKASP